MGASIGRSQACLRLQDDPSFFSLRWAIPYDFSYNQIINDTVIQSPANIVLVRFWVHWGLVCLALLLAIVTFIAQSIKPARYGRHEKHTGRLYVPQRLAHILSDGIPGVLFFSVIYFVFGRNFANPVNIVFYCLFTIHFIHRSAIHPLLMRYGNSRVSLFIPVANVVANLPFHYINADFIGSVCYYPVYYYDPRFVIGVILFVIGFVINRSADSYLAYLRCSKAKYEINSDRKVFDKENGGKYFVSECCLFKLVVNPNYLGEGIEWFGWAIATWSLSGLVWWSFTMATFIPRSRHNLKWYRSNFPDFPKYRRGLIPLIW